MSATPNSAEAGWGELRLNKNSGSALREGEGGQNALQALLAFSCIRQQAERRRAKAGENFAAFASDHFQEEQFALDEVLQLVAERAFAITGADGIAIALADGDAIVCRASCGAIAPDPGTKLDGSAGFSGACLRSGQTVRCNDSETDDRVNPEICRSLGTRSMVAVPLAAKQRVAGLIEAFSTEPYGFNDSDVRSLNLLGELILAAVRPEEEERLAEDAARVIVPAVASHASVNPEASEPIAMASAAIAPAAVDSGASGDGKSATVATSQELSQPSTSTTLGAETTPSAKPRPRIIIDEILTPPQPQRDGKQSFLPKIEIPPPVVPVDAPVEQSLAKAPEEAPATAAAELAPQEAPGSGIAEPRHSAASMGLIAALVLIAIGLGWAIVSKIRHAEQAISANTQRTVEVKTGEDDAREIILPAPAEVKPGPTPEVTGLRQWSSGDSSTVVVELQDQVQYEAQRLDHPARIYFDLHDTKIAPDVTKNIDANGALLKRVRMAQSAEGVTRVVLETTDEAQFSVSLEPNPYRLTIEVHKPNEATMVEAVAPKTTPPPLPKPSPGIASNKPETRAVAAKEFQIVLDAGHGGWDLGTVGKKGLLEKDLTLDIVQRLGNLLESKMGAQVTYTRQDDSYVPLEKRTEIANLSGADMFLSVHANYSDLSTARGVETYYTTTYSSIKARTADDDAELKAVNWTGVDLRAKVIDSYKLAADVQRALCGGLVALDPSLRNRGVKKAQYVVLTGTEMPAVLAEVSFVSSPEDEDHLQSAEYRQRIADALYRGVSNFREESKTKNAKLASAKKPQP